MVVKQTDSQTQVLQIQVPDKDEQFSEKSANDRNQNQERTTLELHELNIEQPSSRYAVIGGFLMGALTKIVQLVSHLLSPLINFYKSVKCSLWVRNEL